MGVINAIYKIVWIIAILVVLAFITVGLPTFLEAL